jgi:hypothetical protein
MKNGGRLEMAQQIAQSRITAHNKTLRKRRKMFLEE